MEIVYAKQKLFPTSRRVCVCVCVVHAFLAKIKHIFLRRKNQNIPAESCCLQSKSIIVGVPDGTRFATLSPSGTPAQNCIGWRAGAFSGYILIFCLLAGLVRPVIAATLPIADITVGKVVEINGQQFVKIGTDAVKGSQFMALQVAPVCKANEFNGIAMQDFTPGDCACLPTPAAAGFTLAGTMIDERDGKTYEVRKFADGKCWMADNLAYGGPSNNCAGIGVSGWIDPAYGGAEGMAAYSNRFGAYTYGNCRDPSTNCISNSTNDCSCSTGSSCGYLYNWQAAMQLPTAYYNTNVSYPHGTPSTTNHLQGICPPGWHLPAGGDMASTSEFAQLDIANDGAGNYQGSCTTASCNFWRPGYNYKGVYSGLAVSDGSLFGQGMDFILWSASENSAAYTWDFGGGMSDVYPGTGIDNKNWARAVRCIKD